MKVSIYHINDIQRNEISECFPSVTRVRDYKPSAVHHDIIALGNKDHEDNPSPRYDSGRVSHP